MTTPTKHFVPLVATVFVMLFLWLSYVPLLSWYEYSAQHQALQDASFGWHQQRIRNYSFEFDTSDSLAASFRLPLRVHVRDSTFLAAYEFDSNQAVDDAALAGIPQTIDMAFDLIDELLEQRPYSIDIQYDPLLHYPTRISFSISDSGQDSVTYYIRSLRTVESDH